MPLWCITHLWFGVYVVYVGVVEHLVVFYVGVCCVDCGIFTSQGMS